MQDSQPGNTNHFLIPGFEKDGVVAYLIYPIYLVAF